MRKIQKETAREIASNIINNPSSKEIETLVKKKN